MLRTPKRRSVGKRHNRKRETKVDRTALQRVSSSERSRHVHDRVSQGVAGVVSRVARVQGRRAIRTDVVLPHPLRKRSAQRKVAKAPTHERARVLVALPPIVFLEFSPDVIAIWDTLYARTRGGFNLVCYETDTLRSQHELPGLPSPSRAPGQAVGFVMRLMPVSACRPLVWSETTTTSQSARVLFSEHVESAVLTRDIAGSKQTKDHVYYEKVFVVDRGYPKNVVVRHVLLQAVRTLELATLEMTRRGFSI